MSSHHFVREQQSACLYIVDRNIDEDLFTQLLDWNPIIIATQNSFDWLISKDIKIDYLQASSENFVTPYPVKFIQLIGQIEMVKYLEQSIQSERITIVGDSNINQVLDYMLTGANSKLTIFEGRNKHFLIPKDKTYKKWMKKGESLFFYPNKYYTVSEKTEKIEGGFRLLISSRVTIHTHANIIFKELL